MAINRPLLPRFSESISNITESFHLHSTRRYQSTRTRQGPLPSSSSAAARPGSFMTQRLAEVGAAGTRLESSRVVDANQKVLRMAALNKVKREYRSDDLGKFQFRSWRTGDVYAPHDLSSVEARKWKLSYGAPRDIFDLLRLNPMEHYKNFAMMAEYTSAMGRIKHSSRTGLRPVNQRRLSKAIRRAMGLGLIPRVYYHPEIIEDNNKHFPEKRVV